MSTPVLICDDSSLSRNLVQRYIPEQWDVDISEAANGVEAYETIRAGKAEIVFLDLNMPIMNGYQLLDKIKQENL